MAGVFLLFYMVCLVSPSPQNKEGLRRVAHPVRVRERANDSVGVKSRTDTGAEDDTSSSRGCARDVATGNVLRLLYVAE